MSKSPNSPINLNKLNNQKCYICNISFKKSINDSDDEINFYICSNCGIYYLI